MQMDPLCFFEVISLLGTALRVSFFHKGGSNWANCNYDHLNNFGQQREREGKTKLGTAVTVLVAWSYWHIWVYKWLESSHLRPHGWQLGGAKDQSWTKPALGAKTKCAGIFPDGEKAKVRVRWFRFFPLASFSLSLPKSAGNSTRTQQPLRAHWLRARARQRKCTKFCTRLCP